jgi:hypothetical protein
MSGVVEYDIGVPVACSDGVCGDLVRVVYDPVARAITHLVVQRKHRPGEGRLVPVELIDESTGEIRLRCSTSEFDELEYAEETHFISESGEDLGYERGEVYMWPYYGVGAGIDAPPMLGPQAFFSSRVPAGEVEVRRGERVHAVDGDIGRVHGFAVDPEDHHVTHVLLEEGHLWGRKEIAIPIGAVTEVNADGVRVVLTRALVRDLPPVDLAGSR